MPVKSREVKVETTREKEKEEKEKEKKWWEKILPTLPKPPQLFSSE